MGVRGASSKGRQYKRRFSLQPLSLSLPSSEERNPDSAPVADSEDGTRLKSRYKVVVLGAARVGKTAIVHQFLYDSFPTKYRRTVDEMHHGEFDLGGSRLTLDILDTAGSFEFPAMRALSISSADAFLLVYSVDDATSWEEIQSLHQEVVEAKGADAPVVVVANKSDCGDWAVPRAMAEPMVVGQWEGAYVECSARDNRAVLRVFQALLEQAKVRYNLSPALRRRRQSLPHVAPPPSASGGGGGGRQLQPSPPPLQPTAAQLLHLRMLRDRHSSSASSSATSSPSSSAKRNSCLLS